MSDATLYAFDADYCDVPIYVTAKSGARVVVYHRLRKPSLAELVERESRVTYELVEGLSSREEDIRADEETANARIWDNLIMAVKGYGGEGFRDITPEDKAIMRGNDKSTAFRALYAGDCAIEGDDDTVSMGGAVWTVRQDIGLAKDNPDFVVRHILREPNEAERGRFKRTSSTTSYLKGAKKSHVILRTNVKAYVELYDALIEGVKGATVAGIEWNDTPNKRDAQAAIDPMWKRQVVQCLMNALEAQLSD